MIDIINVVVVWCGEVRIETGRRDVVPFLGRDGGGAGVERGRAARCRERCHYFAIRGLSTFVGWCDRYPGAVVTTGCLSVKSRKERVVAHCSALLRSTIRRRSKHCVLEG
jgi:hypothetical protein